MNIAYATRALVAKALERDLRRIAAESELIGLSCLARGADCVFAQVIVELGSPLWAIVPSRDYSSRIASLADRSEFERLSAAAVEVHVMPYETASREAYEAANGFMLDHVDMLMAVWDGAESVFPGDTAHAVSQARARGVPVSVVWPGGARRSTSSDH